MANEQEYADEDFNVEIDLENTQAWDGDYHNVNPGDYQLNIEKAVQKNSKSKNEPMIEVTFKVEDIADGNEENRSQIGMTVVNRYSLSPRALGRMKALLVAARAPLNAIRASALLGVSIIGTVYHSDGDPQIGPDGQPKPPVVFANVKSERPLPDAEPKQEQKAASPPITRGQQPKASTTPAAKNGAGAPRRT